MRDLDDATLYACLSDLTGIPANELYDSNSLLRRLLDVDSALRSRLVGQDQAVDAVISALRARLLRNASTRPVLNLLCVGPSGVGKTELAKLLARVCLGDADALVRLDGSEYREAHSVARLIGAPPGYVGHGPGRLTEAVRRRPRSVVLLDECEKAAPEVLNVFLQVMSAGRLTDSTGTTVDFRHAFVILTSNLGNSTTGRALPDKDAFAAQINEAVRQELRPELLGRMDAVVVFQHLEVQALEAIVKLKLEDHARDLHSIDAIHASPEAISELAHEAYSPNSGAREVDRVLNCRIDPAIAQMAANGLLSTGQTGTLNISLDDGEYLFSLSGL